MRKKVVDAYEGLTARQVAIFNRIAPDFLQTLARLVVERFPAAQSKLSDGRARLRDSKTKEA